MLLLFLVNSVPISEVIRSIEFTKHPELTFDLSHTRVPLSPLLDDYYCCHNNNNNNKAVGMAETEVVAPPPVPVEEPLGKDASERREGRPERPRREPEEIPEMTVEEAHKALNALPKVCVFLFSAGNVVCVPRPPPRRAQATT